MTLDFLPSLDALAGAKPYIGGYTGSIAITGGGGHVLYTVPNGQVLLITTAGYWFTSGTCSAFNLYVNNLSTTANVYTNFTSTVNYPYQTMWPFALDSGWILELWANVTATTVAYAVNVARFMFKRGEGVLD